MQVCIARPPLARSVAAALLGAMLSAVAANAEPLPLPAIDYQATARTFNDGTAVVRHRQGKMRLELEMPAIPTPVVGIIDLQKKKMVMLVSIPGLSNTALEIDFGDEAMFGQVIGDGRRVGQDRVNGEPCSLWEVSGKGDRERAVVCIAADNIPLRTQAEISGKMQTIFEVTEVKREPQKPADFELPPGVRAIKLPQGLKGIPGLNLGR
jgi:hypothetical protein